jgi:hypothetical protein
VIRALLIVLLLGSAAARAQSVEELNRAIEERDRVIRELRQKIEALEHRQAPALAPRQAMLIPPEDEMDRALERTLVQQGGLVLRPGIAEIQPELTYARWDKTRGLIHHEEGAALTLRAGLPGQAQIQFRAPYLHVAAQGASETAFGDLSATVSKQLAPEIGARPGLIAALGWTSRTGKDGLSNGASTGSGFTQLSGGLTAMKRLDPIMFYGGMSYTSALSREIARVRVKPGDVVGLRFGGILAASPQTALNAGLNLGFAGVTKFDGQPLPGSDQVLGTLQLGVGTALSRDALLNFSADLRISGNVPNFRLTATVPIRF